MKNAIPFLLLILVLASAAVSFTVENKIMLTMSRCIVTAFAGYGAASVAKDFFNKQ